MRKTKKEINCDIYMWVCDEGSITTKTNINNNSENFAI